MDACLHDPEGGYYAARPNLGEHGDFITAPHVSQMFGELLGLWVVEVWTRLGGPNRLRLVELGPGDGTLMSDALRAARIAPAFAAAVELVLVETSAPLRARQAQALAGHAPRWLSRIENLDGDVPTVLLANEFLDCLPIRQAVRGRDGWRERRVGLDRAGGLAFVAGERVGGPDAPLGAVLECSPRLAEVGASIGALVARTGGAALAIDYGRAEPGLGDTLQAVRGHAKERPLANPGEADLTAHVDFPTFLAAAKNAGAQVEIVTQGAFLRRLGIEDRAAALARANPDEGERVDRQLDRLIGPDQMGTLFKVGTSTAPGLDPP
ncbi:MAG TPA: SAM-dependent methyltransferase [Caulobacteraceae bacterium]|jgi:SAM-dependent MidA family methyltransferase